MAPLEPAVETFETVLSLVYIPATVILFLSGFYYTSPFLGRLYMSDMSGGVKTLIYLLIALLLVGVILAQIVIAVNVILNTGPLVSVSGWLVTAMCRQTDEGVSGQALSERQATVGRWSP